MVINKFRWDIQGLRAIAVLSVVLFHISPEHLPGGYIGVDMFFVISGYLIMGQIWRELGSSSFSFVSFYSRRVKRLFPALMIMIVVSSFFAWVLLLPGEFSDFCQSVISSLIYVSNFWFYTESGYFDSGLQNAPLLHTWSLSVEEQFYIFAPIVLAFCYRKQIKILPVLLGIAFVSLVLSEILLQTDSSFSFYASPSRFWQFLAGGILSIHFSECNLKRVVRESVSIFSILTLLMYMLFVSESDFPGIKAIFPTLATAAIIYACKPQDWTYKALSSPVAKFFGNISYSLYLWHWPVIVFYKLSTGLFSAEHKIIVLGVSVLFGYISYRLVENPFKNITVKQRSSKPLIFSMVTTCLFVFVAYQLPQQNLKKYTKEQVSYESYLKYPAKEFRNGECFTTTKSNNFKYFNQEKCITASPDKYNIILIGDSHAAHWYAAINESLVSNASLTQVTSSGCRPFVNPKGEKRCTDLVSWAYSSLLEKYRFDKIILSAKWQKGDGKKLEATINHLKQYTKDIVILGPIVEYDIDLPRLLAQSNEESEIMVHSRYKEINRINQELFKSTGSNGAKYVSVLDVVCPSEKSCITVNDGAPIQFDYGHLTYDGAKLLLSKMDI